MRQGATAIKISPFVVLVAVRSEAVAASADLSVRLQFRSGTASPRETCWAGLAGAMPTTAVRKNATLVTERRSAQNDFIYDRTPWRDSRE
jgi:hypothetical protein